MTVKEIFSHAIKQQHPQALNIFGQCGVYYHKGRLGIIFYKNNGRFGQQKKIGKVEMDKLIKHDFKGNFRRR